MNDTESELLDRAIVGDEDALAALLEMHGAAVRRSLRGKIDAKWRAVLSEDDVMQETYADAFLSIGRFRPDGDEAFVRWLHRLAKNNLTDAARGLSRARRGGGKAPISANASSESYLDLFEQLGGTRTSPSKALAMQEARTILDRALEQLPENYREVISLYDLAGCTTADVCQACNCSEGAMFMRRARALTMLRELVGGTTL